MIRLDPDRRSEAIEAGWVAHADQFQGRRDLYDQGCAAWTVVAVCDGPQVIGALYAQNGVIHLGIVPEYRGRWASRRVIREMLTYGHMTRIRDEAPEKIEFATRLGFKVQGDTYVFCR